MTDAEMQEMQDLADQIGFIAIDDLAREAAQSPSTSAEWDNMNKLAYGVMYARRMLGTPNSADEAKKAVLAAYDAEEATWNVFSSFCDQACAHIDQTVDPNGFDAASVSARRSAEGQRLNAEYMAALEARRIAEARRHNWVVADERAYYASV